MSNYPIRKLTQVLNVTPSGYYHWRKSSPSDREIENMKLLERIKQIHLDSDQTYGSPRITETLRDEGFTVSRPRVARLMRRHGIHAKTKRKFKVTTDSDHKYPISPNLLNQDFTSHAFGTVWSSDITYVSTREG